MLLPSTATDTGVRWALPRGEATWAKASRRWWRPGLDAPLVVPGEAITVVPSLGDAPAAAHLPEPHAVPPLGTVELRLAWPTLLLALADGRPFDRFRPRMSWTLLGPIASGHLLPAAVASALTDGRASGPHEAALHVVLRNHTASAQLVRRVAFDESLVTLFVHEGALAAGRVEVRLLEGETAESVVVAPTVPEGASVLRPGRDPGLRASALQGWIEGTRRSLAFSL